MARQNEIETNTLRGSSLVVSLPPCYWYCRWRSFLPSLALGSSRVHIPALKITSSRTWARGCSGIRTCPLSSRRRPCSANQDSTGYPRKRSNGSSTACGSSTKCPRNSVNVRWSILRQWSALRRKCGNRCVPPSKIFIAFRRIGSGW